MKALVFIVAVILSAIAALATAHRRPRGRDLTKDFTYEKYARAFSRVDRSPEEHAFRRAIYNKELESVLAHNARSDVSYLRGVNQFSDFTEEEKKSMMNTNYHGVRRYMKVKPQYIHVAEGGKKFPAAFDWRGYTPSVVTAVKDQGQCGSCWAHGATEAMESAWALATGELNVLSQQQVMACTPNPDECGGTGGCNGATQQLAFAYVASQAGGITEEWIVGYTGYWGNSPSCTGSSIVPANASKFFRGAQFSGYADIKSNDAWSMYHAILQQPVTISVAAVPFLSYDSGVFKGCVVNNSVDIDHAIMLTGYSYDRTLKMGGWICRNSWSSEWGEAGYIRLFRATDEDGLPAPQDEKTYTDFHPGQGSACKGHHEPVQVAGECGILYDASYPIADVKKNA